MTTITENEYESLLGEIEAFEAATNYDASYLKEMLEHAPAALKVFNGFIPMTGHRQHAPFELYQVAKLTAYRHCDCGPCYQLAVHMAQAEGLEQTLLEELVYDNGELTPSLSLVRDFTLATLKNDPSYESLRIELEAAIGKPAMIEIALAIAAPQIFPVVKRAMGHYLSCQLVTLSL